jgi:hypothetical protein
VEWRDGKVGSEEGEVIDNLVVAIGEIAER